MSVTVKIKRYDEVVVTPEMEPTILAGEWDRRYADRPFDAGDAVQFTATGKQKHIEAFGLEHVGKPAIVTGLSDGGDVKVLAIASSGEFVELWTPEAVLTRVAD